MQVCFGKPKKRFWSLKILHFADVIALTIAFQMTVAMLRESTYVSFRLKAAISL
jgi:hypothetical protein